MVSRFLPGVWGGRLTGGFGVVGGVGDLRLRLGSGGFCGPPAEGCLGFAFFLGVFGGLGSAFFFFFSPAFGGFVSSCFFFSSFLKLKHTYLSPAVARASSLFLKFSSLAPRKRTCFPNFPDSTCETSPWLFVFL